MITLARWLRRIADRFDPPYVTELSPEFMAWMAKHKPPIPLDAGTIIQSPRFESLTARQFSEDDK